jgi:hypothetical protein
MLGSINPSEQNKFMFNTYSLYPMPNTFLAHTIHALGFRFVLQNAIKRPITTNVMIQIMNLLQMFVANLR